MVTSQVCDSLSNPGVFVEEFTNEDWINTVRPILMINSQSWFKELNEYKVHTGNTEYEFDQYFQHILKIECPSYRVIDKRFDAYLEDDEHLLPLYNTAKDFIYGIVDNISRERLNELFDEDFRHQGLDSLLNMCKDEINRCKRQSTLSIMLVYVDGYTFRVRYFDYRTNEPELQIDLIFADNTDSLIDHLHLKNKKTLMIERSEQNEFYEKVQRGEVDLPPPPPPPTFEKKE